MTKRRKFTLILLTAILGVGLLLFLVVLTTSYSFTMEGDGMLPTLKNGEGLLVNKAIYSLHSPRRGDIIVFTSPVEPRNFIKRVVAVAGDTVEIKPDPDIGTSLAHDCGECGVYVNGTKLDEPYIKQTPDYKMQLRTVPPHEVFVLGDNRRNSADSHLWGPLDISLIKGQAFFSLQQMAFIPGPTYSNLK